LDRKALHELKRKKIQMYRDIKRNMVIKVWWEGGEEMGQM
jgi:hypothetical protein